VGIKLSVRPGGFVAQVLIGWPIPLIGAGVDPRNCIGRSRWCGRPIAFAASRPPQSEDIPRAKTLGNYRSVISLRVVNGIAGSHCAQRVGARKGRLSTTLPRVCQMTER